MPKLRQNKTTGNYFIRANFGNGIGTYQLKSPEIENYIKKYNINVGDDLPLNWHNETKDIRYTFEISAHAANKSGLYNARCPICGNAVFYYQNEHGSKVFFDVLGYPWDKHPCTINEDQIRGRKLQGSIYDTVLISLIEYNDVVYLFTPTKVSQINLYDYLIIAGLYRSIEEQSGSYLTAIYNFCEHFLTTNRNIAKSIHIKTPFSRRRNKKNLQEFPIEFKTFFQFSHSLYNNQIAKSTIEKFIKAYMSENNIRWLENISNFQEFIKKANFELNLILTKWNTGEIRIINNKTQENNAISEIFGKVLFDTIQNTDGSIINSFVQKFGSIQPHLESDIIAWITTNTPIVYIRSKNKLKYSTKKHNEMFHNLSAKAICDKLKINDFANFKKTYKLA